jgi:hypothetical protein
MIRAIGELEKTARRAVIDFGSRVTLRKKSSGSYDVDTGVKTMSDVDQFARVAFTRDDTNEQPSLTASQSRRAYVVPDLCGTVVETNDVIVGAGADLKVTRIHDVFVGSDGGLLYVCTLQG